MDKLQEYQRLVEEGIVQLPLGSNPPELYEPIRYILSLGGKRMRPVLTLLACDLFGGDPTQALDAALGIELFHNFSLVHDDIMDKAPLRRNKATVHEKWNANVAILSGDALLIKAYQQIAKVPFTWLSDVLIIFNETALQVCEGQQYDMNFESKTRVSIPQYMHMIKLKTAVLLAGSLQIGAVLGSASVKDAQQLYEFGINAGLAFQLQDDLLDVYAESGRFGKINGGDIIANKKTFLLLRTLELCASNPYKKEELNLWLNAPHFDPAEKVQAVKDIYDYFDIRTLAFKEMNTYYEKALACLEGITVAVEKKSGLLALTDSLRIREI
jgi:geranylgeranyl diphosphate synthase type II